MATKAAPKPKPKAAPKPAAPKPAAPRTVPAGAPMGASGIPPNAPGGSSYVGSSDQPRSVPAGPPGYSAPVGGVGTYFNPVTNQWITGTAANDSGGFGVVPQQPPSTDAQDAEKLREQFERERTQAEKELAQRNEIAALGTIFKDYGLVEGNFDPNNPSTWGGAGGLLGRIIDYAKQGYDQQTVGLLLQDSPEYKQRFSGNELRRKRGLAVLSPAEYLATERAYKSVAQAYGLPPTFYDNPTHFADLIGKDISPDEFRTRASYAFQYAQNGNPEARSLLQHYYGVDDSHIAAYFLDPDRAQAVLDRSAHAVNIGAAGLHQGIGVTRDMAERYADLGVTDAQAKQGFANAAEVLQAGQMNIAKRFGSDYSATDAADEFVTGLASAKRKRDLLNQQEQSLFAGQEGSTKNFGVDYSGGY